MHSKPSYGSSAVTLLFLCIIYVNAKTPHSANNGRKTFSFYGSV